VAAAQAAGINPKTEQTRTAAAQTVENLDVDAAKAEKIKRGEFKAKLKQAIEAATPQPKTESEADKVIKTGATDASMVLHGQLATERDAATGSLKSTAATEVPPTTQPAPPRTDLRPEQVGAPPAPVSAAPVVPAPLPPERLDYSSDRAPTDQVMAENNVTQEQLAEGNDPAFGPALQAHSTAEKHEATVEARYRQSESKVRDHAQGAAQQALTQGLTDLHSVRELRINKVVGEQLSTKSKSLVERQKITDKINSIKDKTREDVKAILDGMDTEATRIFEDGLKRAEKAYEDTFEEAKGGVGTWLTTWGSDWEKLIENSLAKARKEYLIQVDKAIDEVADFVEAKLKAAKQRVTDGRTEVDDFVKGLDDSVKQFGEEALQAVSTDFDAMTTDIDQRRDGLIDKLSQQYKVSYERMSTMEEKLREENKSLWQRVYDATVGLIKKIIEFKNMLLGVLGRAIEVIGDIIAHPVRFLGNLVSGIMQGLKNFMGKIGVYLQKGLMEWLFGALTGIGLQMPDKFDLQGIVSIVLQILGLTYANFRARAVAIVGEPVVAAIEKAADIFKIFITEGIHGLWRFIKEKLADLKSMVLDAIFDFIKERVILAGITWIIGLLNPASAFFKACKAIYDIVMFFINRGKQIMELVSAVVDSIAAIAKGAIGTAVGLVENALAKAIPVAIGFLAGLLGLGDPSKPVRELIEKARAPVNKAIDWVINLAVKGVKAIGMFAGAAAGSILDWWKEKLGFTNEDGESHTLQFIGTGDSAQMGIATTLMPVRTYLDNHPDKGTPTWDTADSVFNAAMKVIFTPAAKSQTEKERRAAIKGELAKVSAAFAKLAGEPPTTEDYGENTPPTYGNPARVDVIVGNPLQGSITGAWPTTELGYKEVFEAGLTTATDRWVQMHIVSEKLGGSGTDLNNLVPAPNSVNTGPFRSFEHSTVALVKAKSGKIKNRVWVEVSVTGKKSAATRISGKSGLYFWKGKRASPKWLKNESPSFSISAGIPRPQLSGPRKLVLNFTSATEMTREFGISSATATLVKEGRPYKSKADFVNSMTERGATVGQINAILGRKAVLNGP
jgi:hypothetical protein